MRYLTFFIFLSLILANTFYASSQSCYYPTTKKVLLVGDSWGNFMWVYRSYRDAFEKFGYPDYIEEGSNTVENGAEAEDFIVNPKLNYVINALNNNPDIDLVLISLGGNDILGEWHKTFTQAQNDSILDAIQSRLNILIDTIKQTRPGVQMLISGYDYPNFGETLSIVPIGAYTSLFQSMGSPSFVEINTILTYLMQRFAAMAQNDPQLNVVNNLGLMQYMYGQSNNLIVPPYLPPYSPYSVPLPGGNINYPSPMSAMLGNIDAFHLGMSGYKYFAERQTELFFWEKFRKNKDTTYVSMSGNFDGYLDNGNLTHSQLALGNNASSILSFNTACLPDNAVITEARLFLTREAVTGSNPLALYGADKVMTEIKSGHFGLSQYVEVSDFSDIADASNIACMIGTAENNGHKIRFEMSNPNDLQFINVHGITQFRISMDTTDTGGANTMFFHGAGSNGINNPILDIKYVLDTTISIQNPVMRDLVLIFPNPANSHIHIQAEGLKSYRITDIHGKRLMAACDDFMNPVIDISHLSAGIYFIEIITEHGFYSEKLIKL